MKGLRKAKVMIDLKTKISEIVYQSVVALIKPTNNR